MADKEQDENRALETVGLAGAQAETVQRYGSAGTVWLKFS